MSGSGGLQDILLELCNGNSVSLSFTSFSEFNNFKVYIYRQKAKMDRESLLLELPVKVLRIDFLEEKLDEELNKVFPAKIKLSMSDEKRTTKKVQRTYSFVVEEV